MHRARQVPWAATCLHALWSPSSYLTTPAFLTHLDTVITPCLVHLLILYRASNNVSHPCVGSNTLPFKRWSRKLLQMMVVQTMGLEGHQRQVQEGRCCVSGWITGLLPCALIPPYSFMHLEKLLISWGLSWMNGEVFNGSPLVGMEKPRKATSLIPTYLFSSVGLYVLRLTFY